MNEGELKRYLDGRILAFESDTSERRELFRRLVQVIRMNPLLSGLMEREHIQYLRMLAALTIEDLPEADEEPNRALEIGYDPIPLHHDER